MRGAALDRTDFVNCEAEAYAAEAAYSGRIGTAARHAAEAADVDAFVAIVPATQVFGSEFREQLNGTRRTNGGLTQIAFGYDTELVARYLRTAPGDEWLTLEVVPRDRGTAARRALSTEDDGMSGRLKAALVTYGFGGHEEGFAALRRSVARGGLRWFAEELAEAREEYTPEWWGTLLYPGGLAAGDSATVTADLAEFGRALAGAEANA